MSESAFSIFDALSAWGKTLPGWQHFLLNKLVVAVELTDESLDEVFGEYLIDQGLGESDAVRVGWDMALPQHDLVVCAPLLHMRYAQTSPCI